MDTRDVPRPRPSSVSRALRALTQHIRRGVWGVPSLHHACWTYGFGNAIQYWTGGAWHRRCLHVLRVHASPPSAPPPCCFGFFLPSWQSRDFSRFRLLHGFIWIAYTFTHGTFTQDSISDMRGAHIRFTLTTFSVVFHLLFQHKYNSSAMMQICFWGGPWCRVRDCVRIWSEKAVKCDWTMQSSSVMLVVLLLEVLCRGECFLNVLLQSNNTTSGSCCLIQEGLSLHCLGGLGIQTCHWQLWLLCQ